MGIEVVLKVRVSFASDAWVELDNRRRINAKTLICTAGVAHSTLLSFLPCERIHQGQVITSEYLPVPGHRGPWSLGGCAETPKVAAAALPADCTARHSTREGCGGKHCR